MFSDCNNFRVEDSSDRNDHTRSPNATGAQTQTHNTMIAIRRSEKDSFGMKSVLRNQHNVKATKTQETLPGATAI
jgi:hypothetical protein